MKLVSFSLFKKLLPILLVCLSAPSVAKVITLDAVENISLFHRQDWSVVFERGGISAGNYLNQGYARAYEKFTLPAYVQGQTIESAIFNFTYGPNFQPVLMGPGPLSIFSISSEWDEAWIRRYSAPAAKELIGKIGPNPGPKGGSYVSSSVDLTNFVNKAYQNRESAVSFVIMSEREGTGFSDYTGLAVKKTFDLTISSPVPEPSTFTMLFAGLGLIAFFAFRRKQV